MRVEPVSAPQVLAHRVAEQVRELIETGSFEPGEPLRQEEIAARLGVSRIPVREALRLLEAEGLVTVHANRGAFVARPSAAEVAELFDVRLLLECDLVRRAVPKLTEAALLRIEWLDARIDTAQDAREWVRYDEEFHQAIDAVAGRPRTQELVTTLRRSLNAYYVRYLAPESRAMEWKAEHQQLVAALRRGRADEAVAALERHLTATRDVLVAAVG